MQEPWARAAFTLVAVSTAAVYWELSWISLRRGPNEPYKRYWVAFCAVGAVHLLSIATNELFTEPGSAETGIRLSMCLSCLVLPLFLQFALAFTRPGAWARPLAISVWIAGFTIIGLLVGTDLVLAGVTASEFSRFAPTLGPLAPVYMAYNAFVWLTPIAVLLLVIRRAEGRKRTQLIYLVTAVFFGLAGTSGFLLPGLLQSQTILAFLPAILLPLFPLTITAAIVRHRLWGIETILHRTAAWAALSVALLIPITVLSWLAATWLPPLAPVELSVLLTAAFLVAFAYIRKVKPVLDHWFQRRGLDRQREIAAYGKEMASLRKPAEVVERTLDSVAGSLYPRWAAVWIRSAPDSGWTQAGWRGTHPDQPDRLAPPPDVAIAHLTSHPVLVETSTGQSGRTEHIPAAVDQALADRHTRLLAPLTQAGEVVGLLELGAKVSLKHYGHSELLFIEQVCTAGAVALSNALLYGQVDAQRHELAGLTGHLEQRVQERTTELRHANAKLRDLDRLKSRFFANISHELRTPLSLILSPLDSMIDDGLGSYNPEQIDQLAGLRRNALQLLKLIDDLLDLSKLEEAHIKLRIERTDLKSLAARIVDAAKPLAERKRITIELAATDEAIVEADVDKLERVLVNLLSNALKFSDEDTRIDIEVRPDGDHVRMDVADQGVGIPPEQLAHVFDRFHQVDNSLTRSKTGTGIGLSLARELVELHNGRIDVTSEPGRGSTFSVLLPRTATDLPADRLERRDGERPVDAARREDDRGLPEWAEQLRASSQYRFLSIAQATERRYVQRGPMQGAKAARILAVDDNPDLLQYLEQVLGQRYEFWHAMDGKRALELLVSQRHDLVLSDVMMPGMSGLELCQRIKSDPRLQDTPVILLTAREGEQGRIEGHWVGADVYLAKPFRPAELRAAIDSQLTSRRRLSESASHRRAASLETLLAGLAHELRNACHQARNAQTALLEMHTKVAQSTGADTADTRIADMHAISQRALDRIAAVVQSLQQYAVQRMRASWSDIDLDAMIRREMNHLVVFDADDISLELNLDSNASVRGPAEELRQLILNLVENAAKAIESKGRVRVATSIETGRVRLEVQDDGCGIVPEDRERIFDLFYTTRDPGKGVGLGLALVKKTVEDLKGTIDVSSEPGEGTTFTVLLPRVESARSSTHQQATTRTGA